MEIRYEDFSALIRLLATQVEAYGVLQRQYARVTEELAAAMRLLHPGTVTPGEP